MLKKNFLLFTWKNIHDWRRLTSHFFFAWADADAELAVRRFPGARQSRGYRPSQFPAFRGAHGSRMRARSLAKITDREAFGGRWAAISATRFAPLPNPPRLRVLFVSPYPICPPVHGGGGLHVSDRPRAGAPVRTAFDRASGHAHEREAHRELDACALPQNTWCAWKAARKRSGRSSRTPPASSATAIFAWLIHRQIYRHEIDVLQLEYTVMGQYARRIPAHPQHSVRARYLLPVHRPAPALHDQPVGKAPGALGISARAAI